MDQKQPNSDSGINSDAQNYSRVIQQDSQAPEPSQGAQIQQLSPGIQIPEGQSGQVFNPFFTPMIQGNMMPSNHSTQFLQPPPLFFPNYIGGPHLSTQQAIYPGLMPHQFIQSQFAFQQPFQPFTNTAQFDPNSPSSMTHNQMPPFQIFIGANFPNSQFPFQQGFNPYAIQGIPQYVPLTMPESHYTSKSAKQSAHSQRAVKQDYESGQKTSKHKQKNKNGKKDTVNYSELINMDLSDEEIEKIAGEKFNRGNKKGQKENGGDSNGFEEDVMGKISMGGLLNPNNLSQDEIDKWLKARRKNYPTRQNIEIKRARIEKGEEEGDLDEQELSKLEFKLRKKIMILTSDPREERRKEKEMRFLFRNLTCLKKRKPESRQLDNSKKKLLKKTEVEANHKILEQEKSEKSKKSGDSDEENDSDVESDVSTISKTSSKSSPTTNQDNQAEDEEVQNEASPLEQGIKKRDPKIQRELISETTHDNANPFQSEANEKLPRAVHEKPQNDLQDSQRFISFKSPRDVIREVPKKHAHTCDEIISHLKSKRDEDMMIINDFLGDKPNADRFRYQQNTLLTSLLLDEVYQERSTMLKVIKHLVKNNFLQEPQKNPDNSSLT